MDNKLVRRGSTGLVVLQLKDGLERVLEWKAKQDPEDD